MPKVNSVLARMGKFAHAVRSGEWLGYTHQPITDIVNIGIGGSDLGSLMVCSALKPFGHPRMNMHFVSNVDGAQLKETLKKVHPETTLFVVESKTFTTQETLTNALTARDWFVARARDAAEAANRAKSAFLANTSHEIRTPLNGLLGLARLALDARSDTARTREYLKLILESAETLSTIISDILDLSKIEAGRMELDVENFDVASALGNALTLVRERAQRHGIALGLDGPQAQPVGFNLHCRFRRRCGGRLCALRAQSNKAWMAASPCSMLARACSVRCCSSPGHPAGA